MKPRQIRQPRDQLQRSVEDVKAELETIHTYEALMDWYAEFCQETFACGMQSWWDWLGEVAALPKWKLRLLAHAALPPLPGWDWDVSQRCLDLFLVKHAEVKQAYGVASSR